VTDERTVRQTDNSDNSVTFRGTYLFDSYRIGIALLQLAVFIRRTALVKIQLGFCIINNFWSRVGRRRFTTFAEYRMEHKATDRRSVHRKLLGMSSNTRVILKLAKFYAHVIHTAECRQSKIHSNSSGKSKVFDRAQRKCPQLNNDTDWQRKYKCDRNIEV